VHDLTEYGAAFLITFPLAAGPPES